MIVLIVFILIIMLTYVLYMAASLDDKEREEMAKTWNYEDEDFFKHDKPK